MKLSQLFLITIILLAFNGITLAQNYVGSQSCQTCHSGIHSDWSESGHPYKLQKIQNSQPPSYPPGLMSQKTVGPDVNYLLEPGVPQAPKGYTWGTIGWVMGGYHSNARFLDTLGYVIIGDSTRYHLPTKRWVRYVQSPPGTQMYNYSCYKCHTTGPSETKTPPFDPYPGIQGSWAEAGVGCEACHGPGSQHVGNPSIKPPKDGYETCNNCHARDRGTQFTWNFRVEWLPETSTSTGFIRHREQGDMMFASKHHQANMTCATCHDPHKGVYYEQLGGIKPTPSCETCHPGKSIPGHGPEKATCTDCHMPFAAKNADALSPYVSEQSAHFWKILTDPITMFENLDTTVATGKKFIKVDGSGLSGLTLDYTCLQCHVTQDVNWAAQYADNIHENGVSVEEGEGIPTAYHLAQNFPNPFNPSTTIDFIIPEASQVKIEVYSITGEFVATLIDEFMIAGYYQREFSADNLPSGVYLYRMTAGNFTKVNKMTLIK